MAAKTGYLKIDPLFAGLTRPPMIFGVTYMYVMMNMLGSMLYFVIMSDFKVILFTFAIHGLAYMICKHEPLLIEMFANRQARFTKCRNRSFYGHRNSYDFF